MNDTWIFSPGRSRRAVLALAGVLLMALIASSCGLRASPEGVEAVTPNAEVSLSPATFCIGETLTASYDGGPQVTSCGSTPESNNCKGASLESNGTTGGLGFPFGYGASNLHGSVSGTAMALVTVHATYAVEWEVWSHYRDLREQARPESGSTWTGRVRDIASAVPIQDGVEVAYYYKIVCDEETHTRRLGINPDRPPSYIEPRQLPGGVLSACAAIDQVCVSEVDGVHAWRLSVDGGPTVELGGPDNPRCTDAFRGYQPEDISLEPVYLTGYGPHGPDLGTSCDQYDEFNWSGAAILNYHMAGSNLCAIDHEYGDLGRWDGGNLDQFIFGSIPLQLAARERCLAALDPAFVAQLPLVPVDVVAGEAPPASSLPIVISAGGDDDQPGIAAICDLESSCGDGTCQEGCEDAYTCSQDCEPSEAACPPGTYYAPVTNQCIAIQIPEPKKEKRGDDGGSCPAGQSWKCKTSTYPPVCSCQ